ncbi:hypothetical protein IMSAG049_01122 [Clostridiales bacterium]|nr:hypothetical protein IMSAG049_01122 [Clostridiales bacterium]
MEIMTIRSVKWISGENVFTIMDMGGTVDMEDLITIAEEVITAQK